MCAERSYARSISLPPDEVFRNLRNAKRFAMDIGGSLAKLAYYSTVERSRAFVSASSGGDDGEGQDDHHLYEIQEQNEIGARIHFVKFEMTYFEKCLDFIQENLVSSRGEMMGKVVKATGGGAHKYTNLIRDKLGLECDKEDEMQCLIQGCIFVLRNITNEAFEYQRHSPQPYKFQTMDADIFPFLLVNIGSGVSIVKVESHDKYERIGGSSIGGGSFLGLGCKLTKAKNFDELLQLASQGDHRNVDMLVKDIYGGAYSALGLPGDLIASSFGKMVSAKDGEGQEFEEKDIAKSLLHTISNDIGQIACLYAQLHGLKKIYFGGFFIRGHPVTMHTITYAINFWSRGTLQALFLRHEGYLGAIGAFLKGAEEDDAEKYCWGENYAGSSGLHSTSPPPDFIPRDRTASFDRFELDRLERPLVSLPALLDSPSYFPDTVDLTEDPDARKYWLDCFEEALGKVAARAVASQPTRDDAEMRAQQFMAKYNKRLETLREHPFAYGSLTVRSLLDTREQCLNEFHFADPYQHIKQQENEAALRILPERLQHLDSLEFRARQVALAEGLLAGNVFDWGAKAITRLMEGGDSFGFEEAMSKLQARPWLVDDLDPWLERLQDHPHKCALIFADNSGLDIILGVFPFAREMVLRGTQVILCANSKPALNDVTYGELKILAKKVAELCPTIRTALSEGHLKVMASGAASPCLDLSRIDEMLSQECQRRGVDLVVLEGMGRAIHTNYHAAFSCESLKLAVLKNKWLANRLGGDVFSVIFKYTKGSKVEGMTPSRNIGSLQTRKSPETDR
ncbi:4'-phosphopantetheine phosphatase-like isoform X1 [Branchiostoma floridae x Branchiostoma belcheri]